jgi:protein-disulfide isomerase
LARPVTRREVAGLGVIALAGWGIHRLLAGAAPVGADVGHKPIAQALLADRSAPAREVGRPTLTVAVFTDYQCPACKLAHPALEQAATRDGAVRLSYRDWPIFGPRSMRAARVAIAAAVQGVYPALHGSLMTETRALDEPVLREAVAGSGGDWAQVLSRLERNGAGVDALLSETARATVLLGIAGTPAYLIGPLLISGALDEAGFVRAFAEGREANR